MRSCSAILNLVVASLLWTAVAHNASATGVEPGKDLRVDPAPCLSAALAQDHDRTVSTCGALIDNAKTEKTDRIKALTARAVAYERKDMIDRAIADYDGVLRLDTRTGQVSQCSRSDAGWACRAVPDERSSLESEIGRLQGENATLKKELLARGLPVPGVTSPPVAPAEPEFKLPSDAEVDKVMSFLEKVWRRLLEMGREVQKDVERKN